MSVAEKHLQELECMGSNDPGVDIQVLWDEMKCKFTFAFSAGSYPFD